MSNPTITESTCNPQIASCAVPETDGSPTVYGQAAPADAMSVAQWETSFSVEDLQSRADDYLKHTDSTASTVPVQTTGEDAYSPYVAAGQIVTTTGGMALAVKQYSLQKQMYAQMSGAVGKGVPEFPVGQIGAHAALGTAIYAGVDHFVAESESIPEEWKSAATAGGTVASFGILDATSHAAAESTAARNFMQTRFGIQPQRLFPGGLFSPGLIKATPLFMAAGVGNAVVLDQFGVPMESRANGIASVGMTFAEAGAARYVGLRVPALASAYNSAATGAVLRVSNWGLAAWAGDAIGTQAEESLSGVLGYADDPHYELIKHTWDEKNRETVGEFLNGWVGGAIKGFQSIFGATPEWSEMTATWDQWAGGLNEFYQAADAMLIDAALLSVRVDEKTQKFAVDSSYLSSHVRDAYDKKRITSANVYATLELLSPEYGKATNWSDDVKGPATLRALIAKDGTIRDQAGLQKYYHGKFAAMEQHQVLTPHLTKMLQGTFYEYNLKREELGLPPLEERNGKIFRPSFDDTRLTPEQAQFLFGDGHYSPAMVFEARLENLERLLKLAKTQSPNNATPVADLLFGDNS